MDNVKNTPWKLDVGGDIEGRDGTLIALVQTKACAPVLLAAPDMLAEIEQCAVDLEEAAHILRPTWPAAASVLDAAVKRAKATISKATGGGQ